MISSDYKHIVRDEGVRSGRAIIEGTRIGVHDVVGLFLTGSSVGDIASEFPALTRSQVYECLAYYEDHKAEVDLLVARQVAEDAGGSWITGFPHTEARSRGDPEPTPPPRRPSAAEAGRTPRRRPRGR